MQQPWKHGKPEAAQIRRICGKYGATARTQPQGLFFGRIPGNYKPQHHGLSLIGTADGRTMASYGYLGVAPFSSG
jgi:hypothetical protein